MLAINFHLNTHFFSAFDMFGLNYSARNWRISKIMINKWDQRLACYLMVYHILFSCRPFLRWSAIFWKLLYSLSRHIMLNNYKEYLAFFFIHMILNSVRSFVCNIFVPCYPCTNNCSRFHYWSKWRSCLICW